MYTPGKRKVLQDSKSCLEVREWCGCLPKRKQPCPLDYLLASGTYSYAEGSYGTLSDGAAYEAMVFSSDPTTYNKAYARFIEKFQTASQWAVNFAERESAALMIANRGGQLIKAFNWARKGRPDRAAKTLGISKRDLRRAKKSYERATGNRWGRAKDVSATWLELHFGWSPLCDDIHAAAKTLVEDYPDRDVRASASRSTQQTGSYVPDVWTQNAARTYSCRIGAKVKVTNPNLYLANQLGVLNPAAIAWELIPFSFVVDWFSSIGQVLNSLTDFVGVELKDAYTTESYRGDITLMMGSSSGKNTTVSTSGLRVRRRLGITPPRIVRYEFKGLSLTRGATAIALVVQTFQKHLH